MLQTVPSSIHNTDSYSAYADNFDLSLLPMDLDDGIDTLGTNNTNAITNNSQQLIAKLLPRTLTPDYIDTNSNSNSNSIIDTKANIHRGDFGDNTRLPAYPSDSAQCYPTTLPLSPQQEPYVSIFPPSPSPSIEYNFGSACPTTTIKSEYQPSQHQLNGLYPLSPPDSNGAPSPVHLHCLSDIKTEPYDIGPEPCLDINALFANAIDNLVVSNSMEQQLKKFEANSPSPIPMTINQENLNVSNDQQPKDHQLLREYLQDTTFQRKHNLKPLALESLFVGDWSTRDDIEPVISLALDHARKDVQTTCSTLKISPGE